MPAGIYPDKTYICTDIPRHPTTPMGQLLKYPLILLLLLCGIWQGAAQPTVKSLEQQIKQLEEEIKRSTQLLEKTQKDQKVSQSELKLVLNRIDSRRKVVSSLEQQMNLLQAEIADREKAIAGMDDDLGRLRQEYAEMVREAYQNHKLNNFALFLFASKDFNQATRRIEFMRRYNSARESRARQLRTLSDSISLEIAVLNEQKEELDGTRQSYAREIGDLQKDENRYRTSITKLRQDESKLSKELKAKQDQMEKAQQEIQRIIAEEAAKNKTEVRTAAEEEYIVSLTGKFDENKGKLPYPVRGGVIIDKYGKHQHPTQRNVTVNNKGVNIAGERNADVVCVFEGTVSKVFPVPGLNNGVLVRHGNYYTLYANMPSVAVKAGDRLTLNQRIGRLPDSSNSDDVYLHFEVWQGSTNLNPEQWLRK